MCTHKHVCVCVYVTIELIILLVPAENVILAIIILNIQCWKRAYETFYVSVFSDQKMNLGTYLIGFIHYAGIFLCVIGESKGFVRGIFLKICNYTIFCYDLYILF